MTVVQTFTAEFSMRLHTERYALRTPFGGVTFGPSHTF
jgi:hypothetical protein